MAAELLIRTTNKLYDNTTGLNPDFRLVKANNNAAFIAMREISRTNGDLNNPRLSQNAKLLIQGQGYVLDVPNGQSLSKKIVQFHKAWPAIKEKTKLATKIESILSAFYGSWDEYTKAITFYTDKENFPLYFDVNKYLDTIIDQDGNIKPDAEKLQSDYLDLAVDWRTEINAQYQQYQKNKSNTEAE